jgi:hypothetical protein
MRGELESAVRGDLAGLPAVQRERVAHQSACGHEGLGSDALECLRVGHSAELRLLDLLAAESVVADITATDGALMDVLSAHAVVDDAAAVDRRRGVADAPPAP